MAIVGGDGDFDVYELIGGDALRDMLEHLVPADGVPDIMSTPPFRILKPDDA